MSAKSTRIFDVNMLDWAVVDVRGTPMQEARVMNGEHGVYSAYYRLPLGTEIRSHRHLGWVQVMVLEGQMQVCEDGMTEQVGAGSCYLVSPGGQHVERALAETLVLVTGTEP